MTNGNRTPRRLTPRPAPGLLSIVIAAYDEEPVLPELRRRLTEFIDALPAATAAEVIVVDDGSADGTLEGLLNWAEADPRVGVIGLARNFGHQAAVTAGLDAARGDAVVVMDADLQDPPEVITDMIDEYRQGYDVVYGRRVSRAGEGWFKRLTAWAFYRIMRRFVHKDLPVDCGDFRLVSRRCLDAVLAMRETHRFLRGMVAWVGFKQTTVDYERAARVAGETKYPLRKMVHFAWTAAVSFSPAPLRLALAVGALLGAFGLAYGVYAVGRYFVGYSNVPGWTSVIAVTCLVGGGVLVGIGILGEYVGRIFEEVKGRPLYVVGVRANVLEEPETNAPKVPAFRAPVVERSAGRAASPREPVYRSIGSRMKSGDGGEQ
jgi:glycosyltransferase involved in cell wall biosynthesis